MTALVKTGVRVAPEIAAELRRQIARINAGPVRLPGTPGSDDPGFVLAPAPVEYHPDAERLAEELRAARAHPVDYDTIADWIEMLSYGGAHHQPPKGSAVWSAFRGSVAMVCGDFPLAVWSQDVLKEALRTFVNWPSVAELETFLRRVDKRQLAEIAALDRIAKGVREPVGKAREAFGYDPGPASTRPEQCAEAPHEHKARLPERTVEEQLAALGVTLDETAAAALAARRKVFGQ